LGLFFTRFALLFLHLPQGFRKWVVHSAIIVFAAEASSASVMIAARTSPAVTASGIAAQISRRRTRPESGLTIFAAAFVT
jgi:hypothetical protein